MASIPTVIKTGLAAFRTYGFLPVARHAFGRICRNGFHTVFREAYAGLAAEKPLANRNDYPLWVRRYDTISRSQRNNIRLEISRLPANPVISIVITQSCLWTPSNLQNAVDSVRRQAYPFWELCFVCTASADSTFRSLAEKTAAHDARVKLLDHTDASNACTAMNIALDHATGTWVLLMKPGSLLAEHALFHVVRTVIDDADTAVVYSDDDQIDAQGKRHSPSFKPEWDEAMFCSGQLHLPLCVFRKSLLDSLGGFRQAYDPAGEYDIMLRCLEQIKPEKIRHIPRILCHHQESPIAPEIADLQRKAELTAGRKALSKHYKRIQVDCTVETLDEGYRLRCRLPNPPSRVSIIIPVRNGYALLNTCITSVLSQSTYPNYEILIVDNGSDEPAMLNYLHKLEQNPKIRIIRDPRPFNFSALNNHAARVATGDMLALVNSDIEVISPDWLEEMVGLASLPNTGAVGACLWYPADTLQHGGVILGIKGVAAHAPRCLPRTATNSLKHVFCLRSVSAVTGACLVVKRKHYEQVGGLNETALAVAFNDIDFCLKLRQCGYRNLWTPYAELYHHESASRGAEDTTAKRRRFSNEIAYMQELWGDVLTNDPAYNPNLTLESEDFALAWPPRISPRTEAAILKVRRSI